MNNEKNRYDKVWVFMGDSAPHPCAIFSSKKDADKWITKNNVSGVLTQYPLNKSVYDWAREYGYFEPASDEQKSPRFIAKFSSAYAEHYHYEDGKQIS